MEAGRELDALVAEKVMGQKVSKAAGGTYWAEYTGSDGFTLIRCCPESYSTNIAAAWEAVEKVRPEFYLSLEVHEDHINACFCPHGEVFRSDGTHMYQGEADTAPLAICLAVLRAVGYSLEEEKS